MEMDANILTTLSDWLLWFIPIPMFVFLVIYLVKFKWHSSRFGMAWVFQKACFFVYFLYLGIARYGNIMQGRGDLTSIPMQPIFRFSILFGIAVSSVWFLWILIGSLTAKKNTDMPTESK